MTHVPAFLPITVLAALMLTGCATDLQRGDKAMRKGKYRKAEKLYYRAHHTEAESALLPQWNGKQYEYVFDKQIAAAGILGMAKAHRAMAENDRALYSYFHYIQFCIRHDIDFDAAIEGIREFVKENQDANETQTFEELIKGNR